MGKKLIYILSIYLTVIFLLVGCNKDSIDKPLTIEEKVEDFEYLFKTIEENYPFLEINKRVNGIDWLGKKDEYLNLVKSSQNNTQFLNSLSYILAQLNNGHTHMIKSTEDFERFRDSYSRLKSGWQRMQMDVLNNSKALDRYKIEKKDNKEALEIDTKGEVIQYTNSYVNDIVYDKVGYIAIPQMIAFYQMNNDKELIDGYLDKVKDYQALVIDIRGNGGGSSDYWSEYLIPKIIDKTYTSDSYNFWKDGDYIKKFIRKSWIWTDEDFGKVKNLDITALTNLPEEVKRDFKYYCKNTMSVEPKDSINFKGNLYLLVDKYVYSSSEMLAAFAKQSGCATLIGERTGGDGIGSDPLLAMLPNSGYVFRFSKDMGVMEDGASNEEFKTEPDYIIEFPYKNNDFKKDKCIQKVLELEGIE